MAKSDYRLCEVCDGKAFYDAALNYDRGDKLHDLEERPTHMDLDYCAQVAAICTDCYEKGWRLKLTQNA
ncbi:MAG TPA: hypothetical protein VFB29_00510 [Pseudolabrys sp.]|nr:hypothetical protein [Pseudolabrys sp.]